MRFFFIIFLFFFSWSPIKFDDILKKAANRFPASSKSCQDFLETMEGVEPLNPSYKERQLKDKLKNPVNISILKQEKMNEVFNLLATRKDIPFKYPEDGCYARAHRMAMILGEDHGVIVGKVFVEGNLQVETPLVEKGYVEWWYHVAPVLAESKDGHSVLKVIDPSIFDRVVTLKEWKDIQIRHPEGKIDESYYTQRYNYTPQDKEIELDHYRRDDLTNMRETIELYLSASLARESGAKLAITTTPQDQYFHPIPSMNEYGKSGPSFIAIPNRKKDYRLFNQMTVKFIKESHEEVKIAFHQSPTIYYIKLKQIKNPKILRTLKEADQSKKSTNITIDNFSMEIVDITLNH